MKGCKHIKRYDLEHLQQYLDVYSKLKLLRIIEYLDDELWGTLRRERQWLLETTEYTNRITKRNKDLEKENNRLSIKLKKHRLAIHDKKKLASRK